MSQQLINRSADLRKLQDEGYDIEVRSNHLLLKNVPYVDSNRTVRRGTLVSDLSLAGDLTIRPGTHVVHFAGDFPCDEHGAQINKIGLQSAERMLSQNLVIQHSFSSKPAEGYANYHEKMTTYAAILSSPAQHLDPDVTAQTFPVIEAEAEQSVFQYIDTASSRAGINAVSQKLAIGKIGIVGLGGTGSYVLDLVAKTPVSEVHLFDGDSFLQHNAFRSPGAPSVEELRQAVPKTTHFQRQYSRMHRGIVAHSGYIDQTNIHLLRDLQFVFLCLDRGEPKKLIVEQLEAWDIPFIDVGMGLNLVDGSLLGVLRVTTSAGAQRAHVSEKSRISFSDGANNEYAQNIQIADLNALNAALAVIKWKKLCGFYLDLEQEYHCTYTIDGNSLFSEDQL